MRNAFLVGSFLAAIFGTAWLLVSLYRDKPFTSEPIILSRSAGPRSDGPNSSR